MDIYDVFAALSAGIGIFSGSFLLWRAWVNRKHVLAGSMLTFTALAIYWIAAIYLLSLLGTDILRVQTLVLGIWIRPAMPVVLASPSILVRIANL
jgi:hypothetical protein